MNLDGSIVLTNIGELVTNDPLHGGLLGLVHGGALAIMDGVVEWVGSADDLPSEYRDLRVLDCEGRVVTPGFVDAHTHAVFAGERSAEFAQRLAGWSYESILADGGGIHATVGATRTASFVDLIGQSLPRLSHMARSGTTTVEVKTGYGLDVETEAGMAAAIRALDMALPIDLVATYLGAHVVPSEYLNDRSAYLQLVTGDMLDAVAGDVAFIDVFCDPVAFDVDEARAVVSAGAARGLGVRIHADQTARIGATALAAEVGAASADHLDHASDADLEMLVEAGTVGVLLPGVAYSMRLPPTDARRIWDAGVTVAVATDCNPGTSWIETMPFVISLAVVDGGLTPHEALWAATRGGALSLGRTEIGIVTPGALGDLVLVDAPTVAHLAYRPDSALVARVVKRGRLIDEGAHVD
jgi:imidazolonepropionase